MNKLREMLKETLQLILRKYHELKIFQNRN